jgi:hypothetical protein
MLLEEDTSITSTTGRVFVQSRGSSVVFETPRSYGLYLYCPLDKRNEIWSGFIVYNSESFDFAEFISPEHHDLESELSRETDQVTQSEGPDDVSATLVPARLVVQYLEKNAMQREGIKKSAAKPRTQASRRTMSSISAASGLSSIHAAR